MSLKGFAGTTGECLLRVGIKELAMSSQYGHHPCSTSLEAQKRQDWGCYGAQLRPGPVWQGWSSRGEARREHCVKLRMKLQSQWRPRDTGEDRASVPIEESCSCRVELQVKEEAECAVGARGRGAGLPEPRGAQINPRLCTSSHRIYFPCWIAGGLRS